MQEKIKTEKTNYDNLEEDEDDNDNNKYNFDEDDNEYKDESDEDKKDKDKDKNKEEDDGKIDIGDDEFKNIQEEPKNFSYKLPFLNNQGQSGGLNNIEQGSEVYLTEMLGFDYNDLDSDDEEDVEDDLIYLKDIDFDFVLKDYLFEFFTKFYKSDELYLTECLKLLPKDDQKAFKTFNIITSNSNDNAENTNK